MKSMSPRSKHRTWRQQIRILCRYSTFGTLLNKKKSWKQEEWRDGLFFRLILFSQREVDMTETCSEQTSCSVVLISMHDCIWIGAEKAFTAQFHAQWGIWQISPSENWLLRFCLLSLSVFFFFPISVFFVLPFNFPTCHPLSFRGSSSCLRLLH